MIEMANSEKNKMLQVIGAQTVLINDLVEQAQQMNQVHLSLVDELRKMNAKYAKIEQDFTSLGADRENLLEELEMQQDRNEYLSNILFEVHTRFPAVYEEVLATVLEDEDPDEGMCTHEVSDMREVDETAPVRGVERIEVEVEPFEHRFAAPRTGRTFAGEHEDQ